MDKEGPHHTPPIVPVSGDSGALAQFLPEISADKETPHTAPAILAETDSAALGQFLRRAREQRGLTLQQISNETRIPVRHLDALEQGNLAAIPGGLYGRAEVRAYAEMVHVDQNLALARFERALEASVTREAAGETQPTEPPARSRGNALTAIGVIAAAVLFWLAVWGRGTSAPERSVRAGSATQTQKPEVPAPVAQIPINASAGTSGQVPIDQAATLPIDQGGTPSADHGDDLNLQPDSDGELIVITEPAGGRVTVDGIGWGVTPVTIRYLPFGARRIRVTKDGYVVEERVVRLAPNRSSISLQIPLSSAP